MADANHDEQAAAQRLTQAKAVEAAVREAVQEAVLEHKRAGNPVAAWRHGQVVWIPADQIELDEAPEKQPS